MKYENNTYMADYSYTWNTWDLQVQIDIFIREVQFIYFYILS